MQDQKQSEMLQKMISKVVSAAEQLVREEKGLDKEYRSIESIKETKQAIKIVKAFGKSLSPSKTQDDSPSP